MKTDKRKCLFCDNTFTPKRSNQMYCQSYHRYLARQFSNLKQFKEAHSKVCKHCNKPFISSRKSAIFCSDRCRYRSHNVSNR